MSQFTNYSSTRSFARPSKLLSAVHQTFNGRFSSYKKVGIRLRFKNDGYFAPRPEKLAPWTARFFAPQVSPSVTDNDAGTAVEIASNSIMRNFILLLSDGLFACNEQGKLSPYGISYNGNASSQRLLIA